MELSEGIKGRKSIRRYTEEKISHEIIEEIVEAARFTPSWENTQTWRVNIVEDRDLINKIANEYNGNEKANIHILEKASCICVLTYVKGLSGCHKDGTYVTKKGGGWEMFDSGMFAMNFELLCHDKGIGTCTIGCFDEDEIIDLLNLGDNVGIGCLITMGYPGYVAKPRPRKEVSELLKFI